MTRGEKKGTRRSPSCFEFSALDRDLEAKSLGDGRRTDPKNPPECAAEECPPECAAEECPVVAPAPAVQDLALPVQNAKIT